MKILRVIVPTLGLLTTDLTTQGPADSASSRVLANHAEAVKQADAGDPAYQMRINGLLAEQGAPLRYGYQQIRETLEKQAKDGDPKKIYLLATIVGGDLPGIQKDLMRRKSLVAQAARMNYPQAMLEQARYIWEDENNADKALDLWWNAHEILVTQAEADDLNAMAELWFFGPPHGLQGHQRVKSWDRIAFKEGNKWLRRSAERGVVEAMYSLGTRMIDGSGAFASTEAERVSVEQEGKEWLSKASAKGHWKAMVHLGHAYGYGLPCEMRTADRTGQPVKTDPEKAWYWWDKAIALVGEDKVMSLLDPSGEAELPPRPTK